MIKLTAYVRDEQDLVLWKNIPNKVEWLHNALNNNPNVQGGTLYSPVKGLVETGKPTVESMKFGGKAYTFCAHGADPAFCKKAKPGKPCKA